MSTFELIDELEAGELSIEFEGEEPQAVLEWAIDRFMPGLAISTSFQIDSVALIDMLYEIDPDVPVFSVDTGRLPKETLELADRLRDRYPGLRLELIEPDQAEIAAMTGKHGVDLFKTSVDLRLLCCNLRKVRPLTKHLHTLDAWVTGLRRDQWASRTNIRKVEIDHDHGAIVKLNPLAEWTEDEVWDYVREREVPYHALYDRGYKSIGCAPCTRATAPDEPSRAGRWWWETNAPKECGIHCSIESGGLEHELHALLGDKRIERPRSRVRPPRSRGPRRRPCSRWCRTRRAACGSPTSSPPSTTARSTATTPTRSRSCSSSGSRPGRVRALYGPDGEQATLALFRRLPLGKELTESARELTEALGALEGRTIERVSVNAVGPGEYGVTISTDGFEVVLRLGRAGARLATIGA